jgi:demethylmenaquinone methyltransferase/2-methoxy-6-polyprenyl-1,4-benzoquinol methylase
MPAPIVDEQMRAYYHQRAAEYDDWWLGTGLFARRERPGWSEEVAELIELIRGLPPARDLDVACGTGFLTQHLQGDVVAIDQSSAMVAVAGARMPHARVLRADAVPLPFADGEFDRVITSHFYGHLLPDERTAFLSEARRVAAELIVVDSARRPGIAAEQWQERKLNDGTLHSVYKRFFGAHELANELGARGNGSSPPGEHPGAGEILYDGGWFVAVTA